MDLLKKLVIVFFVSFAMLTVAPSTIAAGKIKNQTPAEVEQALIDTVEVAKETLMAMQNDVDKITVLALIRKTKQTAKKIQSSVVLADRDRALARVSKARGAYKRDQHEKAKELMQQAVDRFKQVKEKYHNF